MKVVRVDRTPMEPVDNPLFTGPGVTRQVLPLESLEYNMNVVNFPPGVRNKFHSHSREQILFVTAGRGIVATEDKEWEVGPGDIILIPAGEKHWHGATEGSAFSHIFITKIGTELKQLED